MSLDKLFVGSAKFTNMNNPYPLYIGLIHPNGKELHLKINDHNLLQVSKNVLDNYPNYVLAENYAKPQTVTLEEARIIALDFIGEKQAHLLGDCCYAEKMMWENFLGEKNPFDYYVFEFSTILDKLHIPLDISRRKLAHELKLGKFPEDMKHNSLSNARILKAVWSELISSSPRIDNLIKDPNYLVTGIDLKFGHLKPQEAPVFQIGLSNEQESLFIYIPPQEGSIVNYDVLERAALYKEQAYKHNAIIAAPQKARILVANFLDNGKVNHFVGDYGQQDVYRMLAFFESKAWSSGAMPINVSYAPLDLRTTILLEGLHPDISKEEILKIKEETSFNALYQAEKTLKAYNRLAA